MIESWALPGSLRAYINCIMWSIAFYSNTKWHDCLDQFFLFLLYILKLILNTTKPKWRCSHAWVLVYIINSSFGYVNSLKSSNILIFSSSNTSHPSVGVYFSIFSNEQNTLFFTFLTHTKLFAACTLPKWAFTLSYLYHNSHSDTVLHLLLN